MPYLRHLILAMVTAGFSFAGTQLQAELVKVTGVHACCGGCLVGIQDALKDAKDVSDVKVDMKEKIVTFEAKDKAAIQTGLKALANGGYYGETSHKGPDFKIDPKAKQSKVEISGLHLCCPQCVKEISKVLPRIVGVRHIETDQEKGSATITGNDISLAETLKTLHHYGFHGSLK